MQYGALRGLSKERSEKIWQNPYGSNRVWSLSTVFLFVMAASLFFLTWQEKKEDLVSDVQSSFKMRMSELKQYVYARNFTVKARGKSSSLVIDGADGQESGSSDILSLSTLLKGSMKVECSDSVSWGRLSLQTAALTYMLRVAFSFAGQFSRPLKHVSMAVMVRSLPHSWNASMDKWARHIQSTVRRTV